MRPESTLLRANPPKGGDAEPRGYRGRRPLRSPGRQRPTRVVVGGPVCVGIGTTPSCTSPTWVAVSPTKSKRGYVSTTLYQHQSTLRLMIKGLGVTSFPSDAATAPDMSEFFTP